MFPGSSPLYFDYMRELQAAREHIKHLQIEVAKLTTERDTLRLVLFIIMLLIVHYY